MRQAAVGLLALMTFGVIGAWAVEPDVPCGPSATGVKGKHIEFAIAPADYTQDERACWQTWEQAVQQVAAGQGQWIDVRETGTVRSLGLQGVTAVPLAELTDKPFLKGQSLLLIGTGVDLKKLSSQCVELRQTAEYETVHVVLGGVQSWRLAEQPLLFAGNILPAHEISAQTFWLGAMDDRWHIAAIGLSPEYIARLPVPREYIVDLGVNPQQALNLLSKHIKQKRLPAQHQWLIITDTPQRLQQVQQQWSQRIDAPVKPLWLSGGWPAYATFFEQQQTLAAHSGRPLPRLCGM